MKSAYELAMERLKTGEGDSGKSLSDEQKRQLAEIDEKYKAKIAEREIFLKQKLDAANASGQFTEAEAIRKQLLLEKSRLEDEREEKKNAARESN